MPQNIGSSTALAANATYTSPWVTASGSPTLAGIVYTDAAGGNLFVDQTFDGTHFTSDTTAVTAATATKFSSTIFAPQVRIRYVNGSTAQTVLSLNSRWTTTAGT